MIATLVVTSLRNIVSSSFGRSALLSLSRSFVSGLISNLVSSLSSSVVSSPSSSVVSSPSSSVVSSPCSTAPLTQSCGPSRDSINRDDPGPGPPRAREEPQDTATEVLLVSSTHCHVLKGLNVTTATLQMPFFSSLFQARREKTVIC